MISKKQWDEWLMDCESYADIYEIKVTEQDIINAMLKYSVNAECVITSMLDK